MPELEKLPIAQRVLITITQEKDQKRLESVLESLHIPLIFQARGQGTAPSEMMDIFGLGGTTRLITAGFLPKLLIQPAFEQLSSQLFFRHKGGGIAITLPVSGIQSHILNILNDEARASLTDYLKGDEAEMKEKSAYSLIWVSVASGYSDDVVDTARKAGARGGTVLKGLRHHSQRACQSLGVPIQVEQDFVMIVVPRENKAEIMAAISGACGLNTPAHGIVLSLPVDDVLGLEH